MAVVRDGDLFIDKKKTRMKHQFLAAGVALCALVMTGCSNEIDDAGTQTGKQVTMTMQAATDGPQSRADYTDDETNNKMLFSWRSGDKISVVVDGVQGNENCQLSTSQAGKSVSFSGTVTTFADSKAIYAFYPYNSTPYAVTLSGDNANAILTLPNPQAYTVNGAISNSFMVGVGTATADGSGNINASAGMKQVMSIIKLNITNAPVAVTKVTLRCGEELFPTKAAVKLSSATFSYSGSKTNELSMNVTDNTTETTKAISFVMFPTDLTDKDITIEVTFKDGKTKSISKKGINFERNVHYVMDFDATPAAVTDYIEVTLNDNSKLKVAKGNLVADGTTGAKIGVPEDCGLFFQFGSLIGWRGSKNADGTGIDKNSTAVASAEVIPEGYTGSPVTSWEDVSNSTLPSTDDNTTGIGDPCRYYLKGTWRLPTYDEYKKLFDISSIDWAYGNGWSWDPSSSSASHTSGLKLPASGYRHSSSGNMTSTSSGSYWSASTSSTKGYYLFFYNTNVASDSYTYYSDGLAVRCVKD